MSKILLKKRLGFLSIFAQGKMEPIEIRTTSQTALTWRGEWGAEEKENGYINLCFFMDDWFVSIDLANLYL